MANKDVRDARHEQEQLEALHRLDEECVHMQRAGNYLQAFDNMERALVLRRHFFGAESPEVVHACRALAEMCNLLSMSFLQQDNYAVTLELLKKAEILSHHHPKEKATTLNNMACYYRRLGKLHTAMTCLKKALSIEKKTLQDARHAADTHLNICAVLSQLGKHQHALEHAQAALVTLQQEFFHKPTTSDDGSDPSSTTTQQLERVSVMCIAYHNMGVEQEFLHDYDGCVLSYKKGVGLAEQYLGVDHAIATTIRNSYLAAKRTISTKAASSRRGNAGIAPGGGKLKPRLSTPPSSLRLPSPVTKDTHRQRHELPSPRSIVAEALARGSKTLPPLEPPQKTKKTKTFTLTPEDPFFSPRFRFDGEENSASKPTTEAPSAFPRDEVLKDAQPDQESETAAACTEVAVDVEVAETIQTTMANEEQAMPRDASASREQRSAWETTTSMEPREEVDGVGAAFEVPDAEKLYESEGTADQFHRVEADDDGHPHSADEAAVTFGELTSADNESLVGVLSKESSDHGHGNITESVDEEPFSQVTRCEPPLVLACTTDLLNGAAVEDEECHTQEITIPHHAEGREESTVDHALMVESLAADQSVGIEDTDPTQEAILDQDVHVPWTHAETQPVDPRAQEETAPWEAESPSNNARELFVDDTQPTSSVSTSDGWDPEVGSAVAETPAERIGEGQRCELTDEHVDAIGMDGKPRHEHFDEASREEVDTHVHVFDEGQSVAEDAKRRWVVHVDTAEAGGSWPGLPTQEDAVGFRTEEETPVDYGQDVALYDSQSSSVEAAWNLSQQPAAEGGEFDHHLYAIDRDDAEVPTTKWPLQKLAAAELSGHEDPWDPSQATDQDIKAHDLYQYESPGEEHVSHEPEEEGSTRDPPSTTASVEEETSLPSVVKL